MPILLLIAANDKADRLDNLTAKVKGIQRTLNNNFFTKQPPTP